MYKELKQAIIEWLLENKNQWQRLSACKEHFRNYIYDNEGNYIIGGKIVSDFINEADKLIYNKANNI